MVWIKAHTYYKEQERLSHVKQQVALANGKADELAKGGASKDVAEFAEVVATNTAEVIKKIHAPIRYAVVFHREIS